MSHRPTIPLDIKRSLQPYIEGSLANKRAINKIVEQLRNLLSRRYRDTLSYLDIINQTLDIHVLPVVLPYHGNIWVDLRTGKVTDLPDDIPDDVLIEIVHKLAEAGVPRVRLNTILEQSKASYRIVCINKIRDNYLYIQYRMTKVCGIVDKYGDLEKNRLFLSKLVSKVYTARRYIVTDFFNEHKLPDPYRDIHDSGRLDITLAPSPAFKDGFVRRFIELLSRLDEGYGTTMFTSTSINEIANEVGSDFVVVDMYNQETNKFYYSVMKLC